MRRAHAESRGVAACEVAAIQCQLALRRRQAVQSHLRNRSREVDHDCCCLCAARTSVAVEVVVVVVVGSGGSFAGSADVGVEVTWEARGNQE